MLNFRVISTYCVILTCLHYTMVSAQLSPGELSHPHGFLDGLDNCRKCHGTERKEIGANCLQCHTLIDEQIRESRGMHGLNEYTDCEMCHVEHQGRDFDLVYWPNGASGFDHSGTGWVLDGKHREVDCRQCHRPENIESVDILLEAKKDLNRTYLGLFQVCAGCHFDQHRGQLGDNCQSCHATTRWKPASGFDHNVSRFALTGQHSVVECAKCHPMLTEPAPVPSADYRQFTGLEFGACFDCHRDVHDGRLGTNCIRCHSTENWHSVRSKDFDHDKTRYPLSGEHVGLQCDKCHEESRSRMPQFAACTDCHDDFHLGAFADRTGGGACDGCHVVRGFRPAIFTLEQHDSCSFPLVGAHLAVACDQCHVVRETGTNKLSYRFDFAKTACVTCHMNPHDTQVDKWMAEAGCLVCHNQQGWENSAFDHNRTEYALTGKHHDLSCRECHWNSTEAFNVESLRFVSEGHTCENCHRDPHGGQFAVVQRTNCESCHSADGWKALSFNHNRDSRFKLDGAHENVPCSECHFTEIKDRINLIRYKPVGIDCVDCHDTGEIPPEEK